MILPLSEERAYNAGDTSPATATITYTVEVPDDDMMIENIIQALTTLTERQYWNAEDETILSDVLDGMTNMLLSFKPA